MVAHGLCSAFAVALNDGGHHGLVFGLRAQQTFGLFKHLAAIRGDAKPRLACLLDDEGISTRLIYQIVQQHIGLFVADGIRRVGAGAGLVKRLLQPLFLLCIDAVGGQARQHAFELAQAFHHCNQLAQFELSYIDACAWEDADQPLGREQQQRLSHRRARGFEALAQRLFVNGRARQQGATAQVLLQRQPNPVLHARQC
ncbi:hypothetical protein SDC9_169263 [bioreactor metagenome]|uniref:Uncharacterized protein n=1 Tax=bioreactor metagenome TaxID=1076179 RepID=A0A645G4T9_9ZZZZ